MVFVGWSTKKIILVVTASVLLVTAVVVAIAVPVALLWETDGNPMFRGSSVLGSVPLVDGHNDLPWNIYNFEKNILDNFYFEDDLTDPIRFPVWSSFPGSHTDLRRLRTGKVGSQFWVAYVGCNSLDKDSAELTMDQIDVIHRLIKKYPDDLMLVTEADQIMQAFNQGKIGSLIAVEGGHSMDNRLGVLRNYYALGVRYMTLTHSCNLPWADASPIDANATAIKRNLTTWGESVILEMNRIGMMVDLSHVSHGVMLDVLRVSRAPVIFSHTSAHTIHAHHRNARDDVLLELKRNNGIIMINFYSDFIAPGPNVTIMDVVRHFNHIRDLIGAEHIGIGADYDGVESVPIGLEDVSKYPDLFDLLGEEGHGYQPWTLDELQKIAGLNLIRVFKEVERVRDEMSAEKPIDSRIPYDDLVRDNPEQACRTDTESYRPNPVPTKAKNRVRAGNMFNFAHGPEEF